jgi:hypothetical protein
MPPGIKALSIDRRRSVPAGLPPRRPPSNRSTRKDIYIPHSSPDPIMERDLAGAALSAEDFERLATACRQDAKFPQTYEAWRSLVATGTDHLLKQGQHVRVVSLVVEDFLAWCEQVQVVACLDALRAYMILLRRSQRDAEQEGQTELQSSEDDSQATQDGQDASRNGRRPAERPWVLPRLPKAAAGCGRRAPAASP